MKKINFQFHATTEDFCTFFKTFVNENYYMYGVVTCPFSITNINVNSITVAELDQYNIFVISQNDICLYTDYKSFINNQNNNLVIEKGFNNNNKIVESRIWIYSDDEINTIWKRYIRKFKSTMEKGLWCENPDNQQKIFYNNHMYTKKVKLAFINGVVLCPIVGNNTYFIDV